MIPDIKFAIIMKLLIHLWEERLTCFDCKISKQIYCILNTINCSSIKFFLTLWTIFDDHVILVIPVSSLFFIFQWLRGWSVILNGQQIYKKQ